MTNGKKMKTLAVFQLKGGVGKTTTAVNIAALSARVESTLLWDLDPQGAATWLLRAESKKKQQKIWSDDMPVGQLIEKSIVPNLHVITADLSLRKFHNEIDSKSEAKQSMRALLSRLSESYRTIIIDCPPTFSPAIEGVLKAADFMLVPVQPSILSIRAYEQLRDALGWVKPKQWLPYIGMLDPRKPAQVRWFVDHRKDYPELLKTSIRYSASAERMLELQKPIVSVTPAVPLARNYQAFWDEVCERF